MTNPKPPQIIQIAVTDEWVFALYDDGSIRRCVASMIPQVHDIKSFQEGTS